MANQVWQAIGQKNPIAFADRGYFNGLAFKLCETQGMTPFVLKPLTYANRAHRPFDKQGFISMAWANETVALLDNGPRRGSKPWRTG